MKRSILGGLIATLATAVFAAGPALAQQELKMAYALSKDSHYGAGATAFVESLADSNKNFVIEEFPNSALGGEREVIEGLQLGTVDVAIVSTGATLNFVPETGVFDIPFLFRDLDHARGVLDSDIGANMREEFPGHGLVALAWGEQGFRHLTNSKRAVENPDDIKGLKIRITETPIHLKAFRELGVQATPMAWPEVATALQQGAIDGQENPLSVIVSTSMWQLQDYLSLTGHVYAPALILVSPIVFDGLSEEEQAQFIEAGQAAAIAMRDYVDTVEQDGIETLKENGMQVNEVSYEAFEQAVEPVYEDYYGEFGQELIESIRNAQ